MTIGANANEFRGLTANDLQSRLDEAKAELFNLRFQAATGQLESHGRLKAVRRNIARIYTVMRERELGITPVLEEGVA
jgi:large subunit ribosomal protein L29